MPWLKLESIEPRVSLKWYLIGVGSKKPKTQSFSKLTEELNHFRFARADLGCLISVLLDLFMLGFPEWFAM
jgi:hypothetical protein